MAKNRLDWFKLDCQCDDKIELIEAEFGLMGFAVVVRLWQKIYGGEGYYCEWNDDVALMFARKNGLGVNVVSEIVSAALKRGIFDQGMFKTRGILTSHGIQERYYDCANRRKGEKIRPEYLLRQHAQKSEDADISGENVYISEENADISHTEENRKEESRVEEKREEENVCPVGHRELLNEYDLLMKEYGKETVMKYFEKIRKWEVANGKKVTDPAGQIRRWAENDGVKKLDADLGKYEQFVNVF